MTKPHRYSLLLILMSLGAAFAGQAAEDWRDGFLNPPSSAKPKTWFHAMSANMSREGITKDFEAIAAAGIGGVQLFNVTQRIPRGRVVYASPEHLDLITHAIGEAGRLGLTFDIHNCDGWSSSGGPWITPEDSMKMVVWRRSLWNGGKGNLALAKPTAREGFYRDIAVLAWPALAAEISDARAEYILTASDAGFDPAIADDGLWTETSRLEDAPGGAYVLFEYNQPFTARSVVVIHTNRDAPATLEYSSDGESWSAVGPLDSTRTGKSEWVLFSRFAPVTARYFRIVFAQEMNIREVDLSAVYPIDNSFGRTGMGNNEDIRLADMEEPEPDMIVPRERILDLTARMDTDGTLDLDLPAGDWTILRIGYTSTGAFNNPASVEGRGLECDKLDAGAFERHFAAFMERVIDANRAAAGQAFESIIIDSYEAGGQNWTDQLPGIFKDRNGYDLLRFLPVLTGTFVDSAQTTDGVLYDFRKVVADLMTEEYYGTFQRMCHEAGLKSYIEPYGFGPLKDLDIGKYADVPMGEFWSTRDSFRGLHAARSSANLYGRSIIAAESFTSHPEINWTGHPGSIKTKGDIAMTFGVNRFVFHRYAHQANTHVEPGMTMNTWGFHFDRTQTWWDSAGAAFFKYLARCSYLLQSGVPAADVLLFEGDGAPASPLYRDDLEPALPQGYNFDSLNRDVLLNRLEIRDGRLVLPEGTTYHMIVIRPGARMGLDTVQCLQEIAQAGIPIVGEAPIRLPGFGHSAEQHTRYDEAVRRLRSHPNVFPYGAYAAAMERISLQPDLLIAGRDDIQFIHRIIDGDDFYFFYNPDPVARTFTCRFRSPGRQPELWDPMDGSAKRLVHYTEMDGIIELPITMAAEGSAFVVFRKNTDLTLPVALQGERKFVTIEGGLLDADWLVDFGQGIGHIDFPALADWKDHPDDRVRHFSGTATYRKSFSLPETIVTDGKRLWLDLDRVEICARVIVNGKDLGVSWKSPYRMDITEAVRAGDNCIELLVTNLWTNRLIGEERLEDRSGYTYPGNDRDEMPEWYVSNQPQPEGPRTTFTTARFYQATDPLVPSGLLGPVQLQFQELALP